MINDYKYKLGSDCPKSFSNGTKFLRNAKIPVLSVFDNFISKEEILKNVKCNCIYLIEPITFKGRYFSNTSLCPYYIVDELIKRGVVIKSLGYIKFCEYIDGENFYKLTNIVYGNVDANKGKI